ncbi:unnamed protein product [Symbiodinium sp. KB8]|nr:unnamed protein product [Symbiodinium sp. KB8]
MDASAIAVIVVASILGFGGSILFILVHLARYSLANQLHLASGLESAVLMVVLGTVFEFSTSTVLFLAVARRNLLLLSVPGQTGENKSILEMVKTFLNLTFALVALFKITMEFRAYAKARRANEALHITEVLDEDVDTELCKKMGIQFILVGFSCGFLNGLVGLPGPLMMVHFAQALSNKKMTANTCYTLTQTFFMLTTVMRFNTTLLLRCVIALLLLSSLMGLGILESSALGFWALGPLAKKGAEPGEPGVTLLWLLLTVSASCHASVALKFLRVRLLGKVGRPVDSKVKSFIDGRFQKHPALDDRRHEEEKPKSHCAVDPDHGCAAAELRQEEFGACRDCPEMSSFIDKLLFPAPQPTYGKDAFKKHLCWIPWNEAVSPERAEDERFAEGIPCVWLPAPRAAGVILFCHGNAEDLKMKSSGGSDATLFGAHSEILRSRHLQETSHFTSDSE